MADTTISGLTRQTTATTGLLIPVSTGTNTLGIPVSAILTATGDLGTGTMAMPIGTTAQRPGGTLSVGSFRFNTTLNQVEFYTSSGWKAFIDRAADFLQVEYLIIGGGGGVAGTSSTTSAGGGAGGYRCSVPGEISGGGSVPESIMSLAPGASYTVEVGAGGAGTAGGIYLSQGANGSNSSFNGIVSLGGGGAGSTNAAGRNGGSGGGGGDGSYIPPRIYTAGLGTLNQGYNGGVGQIVESASYGSGGGGGAGAEGQAGSNTGGGLGGNGIASNITGTLTYRGGGGAGGSYVATTRLGGLGGGGNSGNGTGDVPGTSGAVNSGGGGGGSRWISSANVFSASGGSGVVIIRYPGSTPRAEGGIISYISNQYVVHTFNATNTFRVL